MTISHLHQLIETPLNTGSTNLDIYHLKITNDGGVLTYDVIMSRVRLLFMVLRYA